MSAVPLQLRRRAGATAPARRHLRLVTERPRRHTLLFSLTYLVVGAAVVFGTVTVNALAARDAVAATDLERQVAEQERLHAELVADAARLEDPARLEEAAASLGLVRAETPRQLLLDRSLPRDGDDTAPVTAGQTTDPLKPVLSADR